MEKLVNNTDIAVSRDGYNDWLVDTNIKTCHYINKDYKAIVDRRAARFLNDIKPIPKYYLYEMMFTELYTMMKLTSYPI